MRPFHGFGFVVWQSRLIRVVHPCPAPLQLKKYFTFEVTVLDDKNVHRRFRASNYQVRNAPVYPFVPLRPRSCGHCARFAWDDR